MENTPEETEIVSMHCGHVVQKTCMIAWLSTEVSSKQVLTAALSAAAHALPDHSQSPMMLTMIVTF
jgi:hypothetical protein